MTRRIELVIFLVLTTLPCWSVAQNATDNRQSATATDPKVDLVAPACNTQASDLFVFRAEPIVVAMIEHDPIDVPVVFKVRLLKPEKFTNGKLSLYNSELHEAIMSLDFEPTQILKENEDTTVTVTAKGVQWPGKLNATLCARVEATVPGKKTATMVVERKIHILFDVRTLPRVANLRSELEINLVKCWWLGCDLARAVVPGLSNTDHADKQDKKKKTLASIEIRNDSLKPITIDGRARLFGDDKGAMVDAFEIREDNKQLQIGDTHFYELVVDDSRLRPGAYEGSVALRGIPANEDPWPGKTDDSGITRNRSETLFTTQVNVRGGLLIPIVLIFLGIVTGRLNRQVSTPEAQARFKLLDRMHDLQDDIAELRNAADLAFIERQTKRIRRDIEVTTVNTAVIETELLLLENQIRLLHGLDDVEIPAGNVNIAALMDSARKLIKQGKLVEAETKRMEIETTLGVQVENAIPARAQPEPTVPTTLAAPSRFARLMSFLAGTRELGLSVLYRWVQPLLTFVLLVALVALGIFTFYSGVEHNTFGQSLISDYVPLFLWGFGTDVLSKRLQDFSFTK